MTKTAVPAFVPASASVPAFASATGKARLITREAVLDRVGMGKSALYDRINAGTFPKPVSLGRLARWVESEIDAWIDAQIAHRDAA